MNLKFRQVPKELSATVESGDSDVIIEISFLFGGPIDNKGNARALVLEKRRNRVVRTPRTRAKYGDRPRESERTAIKRGKNEGGSRWWRGAEREAVTAK